MSQPTRPADERQQQRPLAIQQASDLEAARFTVDWFLFGRKVAEFCRNDRRHRAQAVDW